jgi:hypothetical protein
MIQSKAPIATIFSSPHVLGTTVQELVACARANPGKLNFASPGFGTLPHLLGEMFRLKTGINIVHVPYRGAAPAVTDLLAGQRAIRTRRLRLLYAAGKELENLTGTAGALAVKVGLRLWWCAERSGPLSEKPRGFMLGQSFGNRPERLGFTWSVKWLISKTR